MLPGVEAHPKPGERWGPPIYGELDLCITQGRWKRMVKDVQSSTWASLRTDHFPLEVEIRLRLKGKKKHDKPATAPKYVFQHAPQEMLQTYDDEVVKGAAGLGQESTAEGAWSKLRKAVTTALENVMPKADKNTKRPWISEETLEMLEHRRALAEEGLAKTEIPR